MDTYKKSLFTLNYLLVNLLNNDHNPCHKIENKSSFEITNLIFTLAIHKAAYSKKFQLSLRLLVQYIKKPSSFINVCYLSAYMKPYLCIKMSYNNIFQSKTQSLFIRSQKRGWQWWNDKCGKRNFCFSCPQWCFKPVHRSQASQWWAWTIEECFRQMICMMKDKRLQYQFGQHNVCKRPIIEAYRTTQWTLLLYRLDKWRIDNEKKFIGGHCQDCGDDAH